jgi:hypothetical protein
MLGSVMEGESLPKSLSSLGAEMAVQRFAAMGIEVVQNQLDGADMWIAIGQPLNQLGELRRFAIGRRMSEVPPSLGLDCAKDVRPSTPLVFIIPLDKVPGRARFSARTSPCRSTGFSSRQTTGSCGL